MNQTRNYMGNYMGTTLRNKRNKGDSMYTDKVTFVEGWEEIDKLFYKGVRLGILPSLHSHMYMGTYEGEGHKFKDIVTRVYTTVPI